MKTLSSKKFANNILVLKWIGRNRLVKIKHISFFLYVRNCEIVIYNHVKNKINPSKFEDLIGFIQQFMDWASLQANRKVL